MTQIAGFAHISADGVRAQCQILGCGWTSAKYSLMVQAQRAAVWHVYDEHPDWWQRVVGDRKPRDERPSDLWKVSA